MSQNEFLWTEIITTIYPFLIRHLPLPPNNQTRQNSASSTKYAVGQSYPAVGGGILMKVNKIFECFTAFPRLAHNLTHYHHSNNKIIQQNKTE